MSDAIDGLEDGKLFCQVVNRNCFRGWFHIVYSFQS
jgi:hypothetical protein